jgi:hypothetical protein
VFVAFLAGNVVGWGSLVVAGVFAWPKPQAGTATGGRETSVAPLSVMDMDSSFIDGPALFVPNNLNTDDFYKAVLARDSKERAGAGGRPLDRYPYAGEWPAITSCIYGCYPHDGCNAHAGCFCPDPKE